jgi:hypothetical protein
MATARGTPNVSTGESAGGQGGLWRVMQWLLFWITSSVPREDREAAAELADLLEMHAAAPPGFLTFGAGGAQIALAIIAAGAIIGAAAASGMIAQKMTRSDQRRRDGGDDGR